MKKLIKNAIDKLIIPRFGLLNYKIISDHVEKTKTTEFYIVYYNLPPNINKEELALETKFVLQMLGLNKITNVHMRNNKVFVCGEMNS